IPMLPEVLSNDLCSLIPNKDRLAFSATFVFSKEGIVKSRWFGQSIIHSNKRFTYEEAQKILHAKKGVLHEELMLLNKLAGLLKKERFKRGAIEFDQEEIVFELDKNGKPLKIFKKVRQDTNKLIEEFMLLANREVAEYIYRLTKKNDKDIVFVYRIHDVPDPEKIEELAIFLRAIGHDLHTKEGIVSAYDINELFRQIAGTPEEQLIKTATIRSMAKAVYSTKNIGHFGLAFKYYTHFTSPIRRYPDIMVHRILKNHLNEVKISAQEFAAYEKLAIKSSQREIEAVSAERDSIKYKQVEYMMDRIGQTFDGIISGVTDWGIYVEESKTKSEGLIRVSNLGDDFYTFNKKKYALIGERTKHKFTLGDKVKIKLTGADLDAKTLDFVLV
ncbi:RNB domain-containing ribonuclease, partial [Patescibacteria group bacterium]|nr:RNB domain-containing ribonuclease [Patescibacteria group bacterium]